MSCRRWSWAAALSVAVVGAGTLVVHAGQDAPAAQAAEADPAKKVRGQQAIEEALKKKVDAEFTQFPLTQFAVWLEGQGGFDVEIDNRALNDAGLDTESMEFNLGLKQVSLRAVLYHALRPLGLTWVIANDALLITTPDKAGAQLSVEMYPAADMVKFRGPDGKVTVNADHLQELVSSTCSPATWDAVGGAGSLKEYKGLLVVAQTREVQQQVRGLLDTLRAATAAQASGDHAAHRLHDGRSDDAAVLAALRTPTKWSLLQVPLGQFVQQVASEKKVPALIDQRGLVEAGIDVEAIEVNADVNAATLAAALDRVLSQHGLACVVDHEALVLTTMDRAMSMLETSIYGVADLVAADSDGDMPDERAESLREWLQSSVEAASWDDVGGANNASFAAPWKLLVVAAPASTQQKVAEALDKLRDAKRRQAEAGLEPSSANAAHDPVELRVLEMTAANGNAETAEKVAELVRELVPEFGEQTADGNDAPFLRALPDRMVVRHRRSVLAKVETLIRQLESPRGQGATTASAVTR